MKQSTLISKIVMLLLFVCIIVYLGAKAWQSLSDPFTSVIAYSYTVEDKAEATGWLTREESVLPAGSGIVDILPEEGEKLGAGQTVAVLYRDEEALERKQTIRSLELELEQIEYSMRQEDETAEAGKLDEDIFTAMASLRTAAVHQDYYQLDDQVLALKSLIFRREYTNSGQLSDDIQSLTASVSAQISSLQAAAAADTTHITVDRSGVFSGLVDGYESIWTPAALEDLTVSGFSALSSAEPAATGNSVGKLITNSCWYFAALLSETDAGRLTQGESATLEFTRGFTGEVSMKVEHISEPENGKVAVVLSSSRYMSEITLLRKQTADIVFNSYTGIRVPKKALRVMEDGTTGVYAVAGPVAEFKKVQVLAEGDDFYLLTSAKDVSGDQTLRAGDEIILTAEELYDGKVIK